MSAAVSLIDLDCENRDYAKRMARIFVGNNTLHYVADFRNLKIEATGKRVPQYRDIPGAPTEAEFLTHLQGKRGSNVGLLVIPITQEGGACRWGKIDVDEYGQDRVALARKYGKRIKKLGLPLVVEFSKSGGVHLAHYSPYSLSAHDMRAKLTDWGAALRLDPKTEIFPKQERLLPGEKGSGINIPYFGGDSDATLNYAVDEEGNRMSVDRWLKVISSMKAHAEHTPGEVDIEGAADLLAQHWTDGQRDNLNLAAGGTLLRAGLEPEVVQEILDSARGIAADGDTYKSAERIAQDIDADKRVPGYPKLVELMGKEDAREFMRLAGGKPPVELLPFSFAPTPREWRTEAPSPLTYTIQPLLPTGVVGMLVAEGGAGKTTFALRVAIAVAGGRELFGMPTKQGRVVYIAAEEHEHGLRRRYHWIVSREKDRMMKEQRLMESIEEFEANLDANLTLQSVVGYELHLVTVKAGQTAQGAVVAALIEKLPRPLELLVLDPLSRLNGAEENSNQVGTALINAGEWIAREVRCTVLFAHHTGKSAAKDRDIGLYAARGASGFVDAARSSIRLLQADAKDVKKFSNVPLGVVEKGDLVQVIHNKSNEGPKAPPFWLRRQELDFERFEPQMDSDAVHKSKLLGALFNWYLAHDSKPFSKNNVIRNPDDRLKIFGSAISREAADEIVKDACSDGDLIESDQKAPNSDTKLLKFRDDFIVEM